MAVSRALGPVPVVPPVTVSARLPYTTLFRSFAVPVSVTVALSLSVTFTVPLPVELTDALLLVPVRPELNDSGPSTQTSATPATVFDVGRPLVAPLANDAVLAV